MIHAFVTSRTDCCATLLITGCDRQTAAWNERSRSYSLKHAEIRSWSEPPHETRARRGRTCEVSYGCAHLPLSAWPSALVLAQPVQVYDPEKRSLLRLSESNQLIVQFARRTGLESRAFSVAGSALWNSLPDYLIDTALTLPTFLRHLKTFLFALY
jgi:hypothetical protein